MSIAVFVSHAAADERLVTRFMRVLEATFVLPASGFIRCTTVPGYRLSSGSHTSTTLKGELNESQVVLGIVTEASLKSNYVLFELGAGWALNKWTVALLGPKLEYTSIPGPLRETHALKLESAQDVHQLLDELAEKLSLKRKPSPQSVAAIEELIAFVTHP